MFIKIKGEIINLDRVESIRITEDKVLFLFGGWGINFYSKEDSLYSSNFNVFLNKEELDDLKYYFRGYLNNRLDNLIDIL